MTSNPGLAQRINRILDRPVESADLRAYRDMVAARASDASAAEHSPPLAGDEVAALQSLMPALEISRCDSDPSRLDGHYWRNSIAVRARLPGFGTAADDAAFLRRLRVLHVVYLMGEGLDSHYVPGSASGQDILTDLATGPGALRRRRVRCSAKSPESMNYYHRLSQSLGGAPVADPSVQEPAGLSWGICEWMQSRSTAARIHVFVPPGEILPAHFHALHESFAACLGARDGRDEAALVPALARFLRLFVRLHPFGCGNYGLAMNIVNWVLRGSLGGYLPHLHLDCCAHRLPAAQFRRLFQRAVDQFLVLEGNQDSLRDAVDRIERLKRELDDPMFPADGPPGEPGDFAVELDALLA